MKREKQNANTYILTVQIYTSIFVYSSAAKCRSQVQVAPPSPAPPPCQPMHLMGVILISYTNERKSLRWGCCWNGMGWGPWLPADNKKITNNSKSNGKIAITPTKINNAHTDTHNNTHTGS